MIAFFSFVSLTYESKQHSINSSVPHQTIQQQSSSTCRTTNRSPISSYRTCHPHHPHPHPHPTRVTLNSPSCTNSAPPPPSLHWVRVPEQELAVVMTPAAGTSSWRAATSPRAGLVRRAATTQMLSNQRAPPTNSGVFTHVCCDLLSIVLIIIIISFLLY